MIGSIIGIVASIIYMIQKGTYLLMGPVVLYLVLAVVAFLAFFVPVPRFFQQYRWFDKVRDIIKGVTEIKSDIKLMLYLAAIQAVEWTYLNLLDRIKHHESHGEVHAEQNRSIEAEIERRRQTKNRPRQFTPTSRELD